MTPKQTRFVAEYRKDLNATQAAIRAGYSTKTARQIADELLSKPDIAALISEQTSSALDEAGVTADRVLKEISRLAFSDVRGLFDKSGNLKPLHSLTDAEAASIAGCEVIIKNAVAGDGKTDTVHKIKVWDKPKNLEMLAKYFGLLVEKVQHSGDVTFTWQK